MKVFSEFLQAPICNYCYYNKYFPCNSKSSHHFFFQAYLGYCNLCSPLFLGAVTWPFSSCDLQGSVDVLCQDNYFYFQRGWKKLKCAVCFYDPTFLHIWFSSHPQHILLLRRMSNINSVLLSLGEVYSGVVMFPRRESHGWGHLGCQVCNPSCCCRLTLGSQGFGQPLEGGSGHACGLQCGAVVTHLWLAV